MSIDLWRVGSGNVTSQHIAELREMLMLPDAVSWGSVTGKPSSFLADEHSHAWVSVTGKPSEFTPSEHIHAISDTDGLDDALDGKSDADHSHAWSAISGKPSTFPSSTHSHAISDITGLQGALDAKSSKRIAVFKGATNGSGEYSVAYSPAFSVSPSVHVQPPVGANNSIQLVSSTASGFTIKVLNRAVLSVLGLEVLAGAVTGVSGASVAVTVVEA